jgi:hypothetical protein
MATQASLDSSGRLAPRSTFLLRLSLAFLRWPFASILQYLSFIEQTTIVFICEGFLGRYFLVTKFGWSRFSGKNGPQSAATHYK